MSNTSLGNLMLDPPDENCTELVIKSFPTWLSDLRHDYLTFAIVFSLYLLMAVAVLCDDYFLPALEMLGLQLNLIPGPVYSTLVAVVTSLPELLVHLTSTFVAQGDMGIGTILGSTVFNIFAIVGICAVVERKNFTVHWWDVSRELLMYSISLGALISVVYDERVYWNEAVILVCLFFGYLVVLKLDSRTVKHSQSKDYEIEPDDGRCCNCFEPLIIVPIFNKRSTINLDHHFDSAYDFWHWPEGKCHRIFWILAWPWNLVFILTVPDCKREFTRNCFLLTIVLSTIWMTVLAYLLTWAAAVIAYNFLLPESVLGLTYLAIGTSIPEAISCILLARKGLISTAVCNAVSANTVDVLLCLGLPWLLKTSLRPVHGTEHYTSIKSSGLPLISITLIVLVVILYVSLVFAHFKVNLKIASVCLFTYFACMAFCCALEMNVFFYLNAPHCPF